MAHDPQCRLLAEHFLATEPPGSLRESEAKELAQAIQDAIAELLHGTTSIVIAHRPSTIQRADQIVVLDGGQVVEQGRPADLLRGHSILSEYWKDGTISLGGLRTASADHGT